MRRIHIAIAVFLLGVVFAEYPEFWVWWIALSLFCLFWLGFRKVDMVVVIAMIFLGICRLQLDNWILFSGNLDNLAQSHVEGVFEGRIIAEPDVAHQKQRIVVEVKNFKVQNGVKEPLNGKVLLLLQEFPSFSYGEDIQFSGEIVAPVEYIRDGDMQQLYEDGIIAVMMRPRVLSHSLNMGELDFLDLVLNLKNALLQKIYEVYSEPSSSFISGLQLGVRAAIPASILNDFRMLGLSHILAISGYNITMIIHIFALFFARFSRRLRGICTIAGIVFFSVLTGMSASVIRAAVMGIVVVGGTLTGRKIRGIHSLLVCAFWMVFLQPRVLLHDLSFQLSALATLSLLVVLPRMKNFLQKIPFGLGDDLGVTMAAQVFTTPIMWYHFQLFSFISPIANLIFLPFIPFLMLASFVTIAVVFVIPPLAQALGFLVELLISLYLGAIHLMSFVPGAAWQLPPLPWQVTAFFYLTVLLCVTFGKPRLERYF